MCTLLLTTIILALLAYGARRVWKWWDGLWTNIVKDSHEP